ncbi:CHASE domain-containing protein [Aromatoleum anaerobium]|uniref:Diguanylate cyclase n=1 Tax=Aromatoleum anaerobium TaxID=182180 RepID=A0ABX1PUU2_9RHOO|nr:CHASE domain-containing protein [Aromatoleum anaerobium]MCK0507884.1 CHASE domain-containing protein [Aromatoleum anaerobium]
MANDSNIASAGSWPMRRPGRILTMTLLAAALAALATWVVWVRQSEEYQRDIAGQFESEAAEIAVRIDERFLAYRLVLRGGRGLFEVTDAVDRRTWREYVRTLKLGEDIPGVQGLGFALWLEPGELASHIDALRAEGFDAYRVWPEGPRGGYSSIVMLEPLDWRNQRALGYDMYSEPVRREAMDRALRTGSAALSGKTTLVQETTADVQAGVLIYTPVFVRGMPTTSEDERRRALHGWVYMPFRMTDLMQGMLGPHSEGVRLRVFDQDERPQSLLYDSHPGRVADEQPEFASVKHLTLAGRTWLVRFEALPGYASRFDVRGAELAAIGMVGLLFVMTTWFFALTRERARALARTTASLLQSERRYSTLVNVAQEGIAATDEEFRLTFVNPSLAEILGRSEGELLGRPLDELWRGGEAEKREQILARLARGQGRRYETDFVRGDGQLLTALVSDAPLARAEDGLKGAIVVLLDITERKDVERRIAHLATHDVLTGIPNRLMFSQQLTHAVDQARRYGHRFALLFVDLDHFKRVNDELGHHAGDQLLREAVRRMQHAVRSSDMLGRRGGDEFVVLLPEIESGHDAAVVAEKIRLALEQPFVVDGKEASISSSIGIALYPDHGADEDALMRHADEAMYRAKGEGRNRVGY